MNKLKELRIKNNLTQADMAKTLRISISSYSYYESGERKIPLKKAEKIANYFNMPIFDIFSPNTFTVSKTKKGK